MNLVKEKEEFCDLRFGWIIVTRVKKIPYKYTYFIKNKNFNTFQSYRKLHLKWIAVILLICFSFT